MGVQTVRSMRSATIRLDAAATIAASVGVQTALAQ
jgi:hypothetical protein